MSTEKKCRNLWHWTDGAPHLEYMFESLPGWRGTGFQCLGCGMRTVEQCDEDGNDVLPVIASRRIGWSAPRVWESTWWEIKNGPRKLARKFEAMRMAEEAK